MKEPMEPEKTPPESTLLDRIVRTVGDLPTMPAVANMVLDKLADPNATAKQLHQLISQDQALAARVLRIANSPFYGCAKNITRLTDAIVLMGFNSIRSLVMTSVLQDFFKNFGLAEKLLWEHSIGCAAASKRVAALLRYPKTEEAFLAGLLHDIGKVVLNLKLPDQMLGIVQEVYNSPGKTGFRAVELRTLGFDHAQIGEQIARKWNFAKEIEETIGNHHHPQRAKVAPVVCCIVHLANALCHKLEIGPTRNPDLDMKTVVSARALRLTPEAVEKLLEEVSQVMASQQETFFS